MIRGGSGTASGLQTVETTHLTRLVVRLAVALAVATCVIVIWPLRAAASEIVDRNAVQPVLKVDAEGRAGITYTVDGRARQVLAWDAVNAYSPQAGRRQVAFKKDYAGGWGAFRKNVVATMVNKCTSVAMPSLPWLVSACRAPDGSYWALQRWQRMLPNLGLNPWTRDQEVWELHLSHWTGEIAKLEVYSDWAYSGRFHHLFGRLTYRGAPVYGFSTTPTGAPLDGWGRNLYLDTLDSAYGTRLAPRKQLPRPQRHRRLLLRLLPPRPLRRIPGRNQTARARQTLPDHRPRPRRHPRHQLGRSRHPRLRRNKPRRPRPRTTDERTPTKLERPALPKGLTPARQDAFAAHRRSAWITERMNARR